MVVSFKAPLDGRVTVKIFDLSGELVRPVFDDTVAHGLWYQANWDGNNYAGSTVASGVFFVSVQGAGIRNIRKVIVLK